MVPDTLQGKDEDFADFLSLGEIYCQPTRQASGCSARLLNELEHGSTKSKFKNCVSLKTFISFFMEFRGATTYNPVKARGKPNIVLPEGCERSVDKTFGPDCR